MWFFKKKNIYVKDIQSATTEYNVIQKEIEELMSFRVSYCPVIHMGIYGESRTYHNRVLKNAIEYRIDALKEKQRKLELIRSDK